MANEYGFAGGSKDIANIKNLFNSFFNDKMNNMFPVGSLVITLNDTNPNTLGYPGTWELYSKGQTLVGTNPNDTDFNEPGKTNGSKGAKHTHIVYDTEEWIRHQEVPHEDRVIYADLIDANQNAVDQVRSQQETERWGLGSTPVQRLVFHSNNENAEYWKNRNDDAPNQQYYGDHEYVDINFGTMELRPAWPRTVLKSDPDGYSTPGFNNPITAEYYDKDSSSELAPMPPYRVVNVWRRKS